MKILCCGVLYSTDDPETYWCIQKYILKEPTAKYVFESRVAREVVFVLVCKKNGCTKVELHRYATSEETNLLERECYSGKKALYFLEKTSNLRVAVPQKCPIKVVPISKKVPYIYGKAISGEKQRARYLNEEGWAPREVIFSPVKTYFAF